MKKISFLYSIFLMLMLGLGNLNAQIANVQCNSAEGQPWVKNTFANLSVSASTGLLGMQQWSNAGNVIDSNTGNISTANITLGGSRWLRVTDPINDYPAGTFAGFRLNVDNVGTASSIVIKTYLNGSQQESKQVGSGITLVNLNGAYEAGFTTTKAFDAVQVEYSLIGLTGWINVYCAVLNRNCAGPDLACNTSTNIQRPAYAVSINYNNGRTGSDGINIGTVSGAENVVDTNNNNFASLSNLASILGATKLSVIDGAKTYAAGTFAGFEIENTIFAGFNALNTIRINTYLNGTLQESQSGTSLFLDVPILDLDNRRVFGFETTKNFNEVQIVVTQPIGINLGTTKVYNLVLTKPCEGIDFTNACGTPNANTSFSITKPAFPVNINSVNTGVTGIATTLSVVEDPDNVIDSNLDNYAKITLPLTGGTIGSLSVKKSLADFPAGTYAGFDLQNVSLFNAQFLQNTTISTYRDGVFQESATGNGLLIGAGSDLLASSGRSVLGFVTTKAFDEVKISINSIVAFNWGTTRVYQLVVMKPCSKTINCNSSYYWNNPDFPVVLNAERTGIKSLACIGCSVNNPDNVINNNPNDYSRITLAAGIGNHGFISVVDPTATYPQGTFVGFTVKDRYFLVQGDLFEFITVKTYNNGVLQESKTSADLFDLTLLIPIWGTGTKNVGFRTTKPFDEIQIVTHSVASVVNILDVYGVFVDTRGSNGGGLSCTAAIVANPDTETIAGGTTGSVNVLTNDTYNGTPAISANVSLTQLNTSNAGVNLNPTTGLVTVAPGTPAGNYTINYQICDKVTPTNCSQTTVTVTVPAPAAIVAVTETYTVASATGGTTASVLANDTLGGQPATTSNVNLTGVSVPSGLTLNSDGTITVAANTAPGTYNVTYQICDKVNTGNCSSVTSQVGVTGSADLALKASATRSVIVIGDDNPIYFTVKNVGNVSTTGTTTITVNAASLLGGGTFSITTIPTGWTMVSQSGTTYVFSKNTTIAPGSNETFVFDYYTDSNLLKANSFSGTVQNAGDTNTSNNSDSVVLQIRAN